jgi:hypothetical protein
MAHQAEKGTSRQRRRSQKKVEKNAPRCPSCGSDHVVPIVHGIPTPAQQKAIDEGRAVLADREEWEGLTEWYCQDCGCDWRGGWRRFKKPAK